MINFHNLLPEKNIMFNTKNILILIIFIEKFESLCSWKKILNFTSYSLSKIFPTRFIFPFFFSSPHTTLDEVEEEIYHKKFKFNQKTIERLSKMSVERLLKLRTWKINSKTSYFHVKTSKINFNHAMITTQHKNWKEKSRKTYISSMAVFSKHLFHRSPCYYYLHVVVHYYNLCCSWWTNEFVIKSCSHLILLMHFFLMAAITSHLIYKFPLKNYYFTQNFYSNIYFLLLRP